MENNEFQPTKRGTIQGGTISPLLACIALHGLEQHIRKELKGDRSNSNSVPSPNLSRFQLRHFPYFLLPDDDDVQNYPNQRSSK